VVAALDAASRSGEDDFRHDFEPRLILQRAALLGCLTAPAGGRKCLKPFQILEMAAQHSGEASEARDF